jgi:hypothetical protein
MVDDEASPVASDIGELADSERKTKQSEKTVKISRSEMSSTSEVEYSREEVPMDGSDLSQKKHEVKKKEKVSKIVRSITESKSEVISSTSESSADSLVSSVKKKRKIVTSLTTSVRLEETSDAKQCSDDVHSKPKKKTKATEDSTGPLPLDRTHLDVDIANGRNEGKVNKADEIDSQQRSESTVEVINNSPDLDVLGHESEMLQKVEWKRKMLLGMNQCQFWRENELYRMGILWIRLIHKRFHQESQPR